MMRRVAVGRKNWLCVDSVRSEMRGRALDELGCQCASQRLGRSDVPGNHDRAYAEGTAKPEEWLPDIWKIHHSEAVHIYREAEGEYKALSTKQQAARRKLKSELRKQLGS